MRRLALIVPAVLLVSGVGLVVSGRPVAAWAVERIVRRAYPDVPETPARALAVDLGARRPLVLVDVRTAPEFAVSHLAGARRIEPGAPASVLADVPRGARIVAYCSVGWRSAAFAATLRAAGYAHVENLRGGVFAWAGEGRPVVDARGAPARTVHPYDPTWGLVLRPDLRAPAR